MSFCIELEDLVANAFIYALSKDEAKRFFSYGQLENYGMAVVNLLKARGKEAHLFLSRDETEKTLLKYSKFFKEIGFGIQLNDNVIIEDLIEEFRGYLDLDVLFAFIDEQVLLKLQS